MAHFPTPANDHSALLDDTDPVRAANKRLVYDMYRVVLQAGDAERAGEFVAEGYIQHNPNAGQGLAGIQDYVRSTRPIRPVRESLSLPLIHMMADANFVMLAFVRTETGPDGAPYRTTWFDMFRIEDGLIAEHWDPMIKGEPPIDPNNQILPD